MSQVMSLVRVKFTSKNIPNFPVIRCINKRVMIYVPSKNNIDY